jgi:hypothetical protein
MTVEMFREDGFHMHTVDFSDDQITIRYTHQVDALEDMAITKEVHISSQTDDQQLQYWLQELHQSVNELVGRTQQMLTQKKRTGLTGL